MRIDCDATGPELGPYLLGDITGQRRRQVAEHLAGCAACRDELERERALRAGLASLPTATCPAGVSARILAAVDGEKAGAGRRRRLDAVLATGLLAATVAVILLVRPGATAHRPDGPAGTVVAAAAYTPAQVATARHDLIRTLTLTARVLEQAGRSTLVDVFSDQLPSAVEGSLRPLDDRTRGG